MIGQSFLTKELKLLGHLYEATPARFVLMITSVMEKQTMQIKVFAQLEVVGTSMYQNLHADTCPSEFVY